MARKLVVIHPFRAAVYRFFQPPEIVAWHNLDAKKVEKHGVVPPVQLRNDSCAPRNPIAIEVSYCYASSLPPVIATTTSRPITCRFIWASALSSPVRLCWY